MMPSLFGLFDAASDMQAAARAYIASVCSSYVSVGGSTSSANLPCNATAISLMPFIQQYPKDQQAAAAAALVTAGAPASSVNDALQAVQIGDIKLPWWATALSVAGGVVGAYHGYKRNKSVGWAVGWSLLGSIVPFVVIPVAIAQGIGKEKS